MLTTGGQQAREGRPREGMALRWLRTPDPRLTGRTPLSLLKTDTGSRIVEELLLQIDEGMFA